MDFQCREVDHFRVFPCFNRKIGCPLSRYYYRLIESPENDQALLENNYVIYLDSPVLRLNVENLLKQNFYVNVLERQFIIHVEILKKLIKTYNQKRISMVPSHIVYFSVCLLGDAETASRYSYDLKFDLQHFSLIKVDQLYTENRSEPDSPKDYHLAVVAKLRTTLELNLEIILTEISPSSFIRCDITNGNIHRSRSGLSCTNCVNALQHCKFKNKGCSFVDTYTKVEIHRKWHCNYNRTCTICNRKITSSCLQHYKDKHRANLIEQHQNWTDIMLHTYFIIDHTIGFLICEYKECYDFNSNEKYLEFKMHSNKRSGDLYRYQCKLIYCTRNKEENNKILELGSCNNRVEKYSDWSTRIYLRKINIDSFQIDLTEQYPDFEHNKEENNKILELGSCNNRVEKYSDCIYLRRINIGPYQIDLS